MRGSKKKNIIIVIICKTSVYKGGLYFMTKIIIPRRFKEKLSEESFVYTLAANVNDILDLPMKYFQEYTLHDESHINDILRKADALIPDGTLARLNETSIEILVSSIMVHDLGMFIQKDGVESLLFGAYKNKKIDNLDFLTWEEEWKRFYKKIRRYNHQQLVEVLGENPVTIKLPDDSVDDTGENWRVYGEFLRKFHSRLAHDIVLYGFFGNVNNDIFANCTSANIDFVRDMIGLVARSHGMKLRDTENYLKGHRLLRRENEHSPMGIPIYYLMSVLRLADYLHAGTKRATMAREQAQTISSPVSKNEFLWNGVVYSECVFHIGSENRRVDEGNFGENKGDVEIIADPQSGTVFLALEKWIHSIQQELDICWAILSEKYGVKYELSIHRIVTNIFDDNSLLKYNKKFVTKRAAISANPEIAKLLVAPLYGDNPTFGVRELIQNAVDACNERNEWERRHKLKKTKGKIKIEVDTEQKIFKISDNGIGMNAEVLINYFLIAGSSFRDSNVWHEHNKDDKNRTVTVRSGRFGIGALATFLLGDTSNVITRHIADQDNLGYSFSYDIKTSKALEIIRVENVNVGTEIMIPLKQQAVDFFNEEYSSYKTEWYNWYHFSEPEILITLNGSEVFNKQPLKPRFLVPNNQKHTSGWFYCTSKEYTSIHWGYHVTREDMRVFLCNGITVHDFGNEYRNRNDDKEPFIAESNLGINIRLPEISVIDKEGNLGLNIARSDVTYFKLEDKFGEELCKYWLAQILISDPLDEKDQYKGIMPRYKTVLTYNSESFTINNWTLLFHTGMDILLLGDENMWKYSHLELSENLSDTLIIYERLFPHNSIISFGFDHQILLDKNGVNPSCKEMWIRKTEIVQSYLSLKLENEKIPLEEVMELIKVDAEEYYWSSSEVSGPRKSPVTLSDKISMVIRIKPELSAKDEKNLMLKVLKKYIPVEVNHGLIPVDMEKRKEMYPKAFKELSKYMKVEESDS